MKFKVFNIPPFDRQLKKLAKKYPSLKNEFSQLINDLENNPVKGSSLGNGCYKIRLAIKSKGKGKSGGARVIIYVQYSENSIYLISIYDKTENENITENEIKYLMSYIV